LYILDEKSLIGKYSEKIVFYTKFFDFLEKYLIGNFLKKLYKTNKCLKILQIEKY